MANNFYTPYNSKLINVQFSWLHCASKISILYSPTNAHSSTWPPHHVIQYTSLNSVHADTVLGTQVPTG